MLLSFHRYLCCSYMKCITVIQADFVIVIKMHLPLQLLCLAVLLFLTDSAPANDTAPGDGLIEIPAGVLDISVNDTIDLSINGVNGDVAGSGLMNMLPAGEVAATGIQSDTSNNNQGDGVETGNLPNPDVNADQVLPALADIQSGFDNVVAELEGAGKLPEHALDTPANEINTQVADASLVKEPEVRFPGPYVTVEEANADNDKLYLDPAICKQCNPDITVRNSCFLKHPRDCRKHIHCTFQKGKWTAYNMRCGFGTFWSNEHNTCQFSHMVECTTDLCRNPRLKSYDNALNDNCRAYWSCEEGHSVPMCCEKYFSYHSGQCVPDNNCTTECPDPCQNTDITSYANDLSCRNFYECHDRKSKSLCCAVGQAFMNGTCVDDSLCDMPCPVGAILLDRKENMATTKKPTTKSTCSLEAVGSKEFQSIGNTNKHHVMTCPGNLVFRVEKCTCDFPTADVLDTLPRECKPEVCVDFESDLKSLQVENHHQVKMSEGRGQFDGDSYLAIPMYSFNERFSKKINIKMLFKSRAGIGQDRQVLVSNCRTVISAENSRLSPSLAILIDKSLQKNFVIYLGTTKTNGNASIAHTFQPNQWTSLELIFDGQRLSAKTNTIDYDTGRSIDSQFDTKELTGELKVGLESLKIGKCLLRDGFHGEMDDVCIGDCLNGKFSGSPPV